ncbi:MAG: hypothetical protein GF368_05350 [Candidatus Aenigmarchaeota archaeon]|nr:hypothetical protein [Candidatus Aenigmarchaeota archaeon]
MEERILTINLRKNGLKVSREQKAKRAISFIKKSLERHMGTDYIEIGSSVNEAIWKGGSQKVPAKIKLKVIKSDDGKVTANIWGKVIEEIKPEEPGKQKKEPEEKKPKDKETKKKSSGKSSKSSNK